ncbi:MAG: YceI family protein [Cytophagales bacterium]|nr:YceI family protein [Cytophagales bacterium]
MKNFIRSLSFIFLFLGFQSFGQDNQEVLDVDPNQSEILWLAKKVTGQHNGHIMLKGGSIIHSDGELKGGAFTVEMNTLKVDDIKNPGKNKKLVHHLKSKDFFETNQYPTANFEITQVTPTGRPNIYRVSGNMSIRNQTQPMSFPVEWKKEGNRYTAKAYLIINRTKFGITYKSGSFFDNLKNRAIDDNFKLDILIRTAEIL